MEKFKSELHYYLREKLWHHAIVLCTNELKQERDAYVSFWRSFAHSQEGNLIEAIRDAEPLQSSVDFKYSATIALITYHNMYSTPDSVKIDKLSTTESEYESQCTASDIINAMRFYSYLGDDEKYNDLSNKLVSVVGTSDPDPEEIIVKGWKCAMDTTSDSWSKGSEYFEKYIKEYGNENFDAVFGGIKCMERKKEYDSILDVYQTMTKLNNSFIPLHIERLKIYLLKNDYEVANDYISSRFSMLQTFDIYKILSLCNLTQDGDFKNALMNLTKMWNLILTTEPKNPELYYKTAQVFIRTCDKHKDILDLCEKMIDKAIEFDPKNAKYLIEKSYLRLYNGELETALDMFSKCSEYSPENKDSSIGVIYCKILQCKYKEAYEDIKFLKEMNEATNTHKHHKLYLFEAMIKSANNEREETTLTCIKEALKIYINMNKQSCPWNKYEVLISTEYDFLYDLAKVLLDYYDFSIKIASNAIPNSLKQAEKLLHLLTKNKYMLSGHLLKSKYNFITSDIKGAFNDVNGVLSVDSKNLEALMLKAMFCIESGDYPKAKEVINEAMITNRTETKENSAFLILKAKCELGLNDTENAQKSLNTALAHFDMNLHSDQIARNSLFKLKHSDKLDLMKVNIDILLKLGNIEEAQTFMNKLVVEFQDLGDELLMLHSDLALKTDDIKKAVNLLRKVGDKDEKVFKQSRIKLADIYITKIQDRRLYTWCYNEILEKFRTFDNYTLAAQAMMKIDSPDDAVEYYKQSLNIRNDMAVMRDLGRALVKTHDYREAIDYFVQAAQIDERAITSQTVLKYWEICDDYLNMLYLLSQNNSSDKEKLSAKIELKTKIEDNIKKITPHMSKYKDYDNYKLKHLSAKIRFLLAKVMREIYIENNNAFKKDEIFKTLEDALKFEKEFYTRVRELKIEILIKEGKELLSEIWFHIGKYYDTIEPKSDFCERAYVEAINNDATNVQALYAVSELHMRKGNYNEAQRYIDMLLKEDESNDDALALLISVLNAKKSNESSIKYLESTIQKQSNAYHLIELYIEILRRSGTLSNAKDIIHKSERTLKYTYTPGLYYCKGLFYKYMGEINKALIEFSRAKTDEEYGTKCVEQMLEIYINPDCDVMLINLDLPWKAADSRDILNYTTDGLNLDAINFLLHELKTRRDDEKTKVYEAYVAILSKDKNTMALKAKELQEILNKNNKDNLPIWIALIMLNLVMKNNTEVKNQLKIMEKITLNIKYYTDYERGFLIWAYLMMMNDNFNKAEDHIKKVLLLNKAQIKAYEYSAMIKYRQGKHEESCSKYEKAWEYSNTNNANIGHKLAVSYINCKQHIKALNVCNEIKRKFPNYPIDDVYQQAKNALDNDRIS